MKEPDFRHAYAEDQVRLRIAFLVRALRESRNLSQRELADKMRTSQSVVARIEDPDYGSLTVNTLLNVAKALDLPLFVDMPEWPNWLSLMEDHTKASLQRKSFDLEDCVQIGDVSEPFNLILRNKEQPYVELKSVIGGTETSRHQITGNSWIYSLPQETSNGYVDTHTT